MSEERLLALLGAPGLERLVERIARRVRLGQPLTGTIALHDASPEERAAVARLLGRSVGTGGSVAVSLDRVAAVLEAAGLPADLGCAVEAITGPIVDEAAARQADAADWAAVIERAAGWAEPLGLGELIAELAATGTLRRLAGDHRSAEVLLGQLRTVVERLPATGVPRPVFATAALGESHALDDGRPVTGLVLRAAAVMTGQPPGSGATWRQRVWASVGVVAADVTAPVLTLGLPGDASVLGRVLRLWREAGQPVHCTVRQLVEAAPAWDVAGVDVFVCENPSVVSAAADHLGPRSKPLVCTAGHPAAAATTLLGQLRDAGARLQHHGDFDWAGLVITNGLIERHGLRPWRMAVEDYRAVVAHGTRALVGAPATASWDPELAPAMAAAGVAVDEELVLDALLTDLAGG